MLQIPPLLLLEMIFSTKQPITQLPHYHGIHWSALFRYFLNPFSDDPKNLARLNWVVQPTDTGVYSYKENQKIRIGVSLPVDTWDIFQIIIPAFHAKNLPVDHAHFVPGKSIELIDIRCRISRHSIHQQNPVPLSAETLEPEINALTDMATCQLLFYSPLRIKRPAGYKKEGSKYCDPDFFYSSMQTEPSMPISHLMNNLRNLSTPTHTLTKPGPVLSQTGVTWLESAYLKGDPQQQRASIPKNIGGVVGSLEIAMNSELSAASKKTWIEHLVVGQYVGMGKNSTAGFGYYSIPELDSVRTIQPLTRLSSIMKEKLTGHQLQTSLGKVKDGSPGLDFISKQDIESMEPVWFDQLAEQVHKHTYRMNETKTIYQKKEKGAQRPLKLMSVVDRLLHRAVSDILQPAQNYLLSTHVFSYREGYNCEQAAYLLQTYLQRGYKQGIKCDVETFFESLDRKRLGMLLNGLFPFEPLVERIMVWLEEIMGEDPGIPQGSPLSPFLSNLYLDFFDRKLNQADFKLIRYSDDFVLLSRTLDTDVLLNEAKNVLGLLGLSVKEDKQISINTEYPVEFLGYVISTHDVALKKKRRHNTPGQPFMMKPPSMENPSI